MGDADDTEPPIVATRITEHPQGRSCAWCGTWVPYAGIGRPRTHCSKSCRNRASELRTVEVRLDRDIAAGRIDTSPRREVVERVIERVVRAPQPDAPAPHRAREWEHLLNELVDQLGDGELRHRHFDHGRIYAALNRALAALDRAHPGGLRNL